MTTSVYILHAPDDWGEDGCPILDGWWVYVDDARDEDAIGPFPTRQDAEAVAADRRGSVRNTDF